MGYIWSIYGYFEALISQILAFLWSEFLLYQFSAPNLDKGTIFFPPPPPPPNDWTIYTLTLKYGSRGGKNIGVSWGRILGRREE